MVILRIDHTLGRVYHLPIVGSEVPRLMNSEQDKDMEPDVLAASLKQGFEESQDLLDFLALKFEGPLSQLMTVHRKGGLFAKKGSVHEIILRFDDRHFQIARDARGFVSTKIMKEVRGIVLKTEAVEVDEWVRQLAGELARQAERSAALRTALSQFILE